MAQEGSKDPVGHEHASSSKGDIQDSHEEVRDCQVGDENVDRCSRPFLGNDDQYNEQVADQGDQDNDGVGHDDESFFQMRLSQVSRIVLFSQLLQQVRLVVDWNSFSHGRQTS